LGEELDVPEEKEMETREGHFGKETPRALDEGGRS